jgi:hypothetical protein
MTAIISRLVRAFRFVRFVGVARFARFVSQ